MANQLAPGHARATPLLLREHAVSVWHRVLPSGVSLDTALQPEMWSGHVNTLRPGARVTLDTEDHEWTAELYVRAVDGRSVQFKVLSHVQIAPEVAAEPIGGFKVQYAAAHKFRVVREADRSVLKYGFPTREAAESWLREHVASIKSAA